MNKAYSNKALPAGTVLREWRLEEVLGVGGFGILYKGRRIYFDASPMRLPALPMFRGVAPDRWVAIWPASAIDGPDSPVLNSQF